MKNLTTILAVLFIVPCVFAQQPEAIEHRIVALEEGKFLGWPANNGVWRWGDEILVGFTEAEYELSSGHNLTGIQHSVFARSEDGGETWTKFDPENFLDDENIKWLPKGKTFLDTPLDFSDDGFAMRIFATGYHGNDDPRGGFYYSYDRGATWNGPHHLGEINDQPELKGKVLSPRTDYIVTGAKECFIFISANVEDGPARVGCIRTTDGGLSFEFVAWVTPETEGFRAIMPSTVQIDDDTFVTTVRQINRPKTPIESSITAYISTDRCETWSELSTVRLIKENSNPPALVKLQDGRLGCLYGDRDTKRICGRYSSDNGATWGEEFVIREAYEAEDDWADMGYVRLVQRPDGHLVAMYYWASPDHPQQHIAASIWKP